MDDSAFAEKKRELVMNYKSSSYLSAMKTKVDTELAKPGRGSQCPFSVHNQNEACREWGWTQDEAHWKLVIQVVVEFIKTVCHYNWKIRNVIESNILPEHHGIGDRYEDLIICPTYVGILTKDYDFVAKKGDKDTMQQMKQAKADTAAARAATEVLPPLAAEPNSKRTGPPPQSPRKGGFLAFLTGKKKDKFEQNPYS